MADINWLPLESNPDVMNSYVERLGVPINTWKFLDVFSLDESGIKSVPRPVLSLLLLLPATQYVFALGVSKIWQFVDVWGFDPELLLMVPRPVAAVLCVYPITEKSEEDPLGTLENSPGLYFIKQKIGNACGTIGLIHALCNNADKLDLDPTKHLKKFLEDSKELSADDKATLLENDDAFSEAHEESAHKGQTEPPPRDKKLNLHFVAFVHHEGGLFELDGRKEGPYRHGNTTEDSLLEDTVTVVKKFMARDPDNLNFTVVALAKA